MYYKGKKNQPYAIHNYSHEPLHQKMPIFIPKLAYIVSILVYCLNRDPQTKTRAPRGVQKLTQKCRGNFFFNLLKNYIGTLLQFVRLRTTMITSSDIVDSELIRLWPLAYTGAPKRCSKFNMQTNKKDVSKSFQELCNNATICEITSFGSVNSNFFKQ